MIAIVIDDEEGVRRSLQRVLQRDGYDVLLAEDGETALTMVRETRRDIETVISDLKMPGMDGMETLTEIGRINPEITRIMLTGYATMACAIDAVNAGLDGFLTKPFENLELRAKVRECNMKKRLRQFVAEPVYLELQQEGKRIAPRKQEVSVLFADIRNFSRQAEAMEPQELAEWLNHCYFSPLDGIIFDSRGTLDKHIGDGIMGIFGAPKRCEDDTLNAVRCALRMRQAVQKAEAEADSRTPRLAIGIGIATGNVMAGVFGSSRKKEYTVLGHPVNLASRLEGLAREGEILICEETRRRVDGDVEVEAVPNVVVKGLERPMTFYRVLGERDS